MNKKKQQHGYIQPCGRHFNSPRVKFFVLRMKNYCTISHFFFSLLNVKKILEQMFHLDGLKGEYKIS